jgi:hypothetical protein
MFLFIIWLILTYLIVGVHLYFLDLFKGTSETASLRNAVRKLGIRGLLYMFWLTMPGFVLFWGLGPTLRERASDWLYDNILRHFWYKNK